MPVQIRLLSILLIAGSLFAAACQPTVNVSRATAGVAVPPPAPKEASLVPNQPRPSAVEGHKVFERAQCIVCHGREGRGDGPAAANLKSSGRNLMTDFFRLIGINLRGEQLPSRPANFHNTVAMRLNSPFSMYETVSRGRPHTAMPAFPKKGGKPAYGANFFGVNLTDEDRWNVIFHEWTYATSPEEIARGKRLYEQTCATCHGTAGDGGGPQGVELSRKLWGWARGEGPGIFTDINLMAQRKPTELFQRIMDGRGDMPAYRGKFSVDDVWALVNYLYTFIYEHPSPP